MHNYTVCYVNNAYETNMNITNSAHTLQSSLRVTSLSLRPEETNDKCLDVYTRTVNTQDGRAGEVERC